ncbi:hypothetical protein ACFPZ0_10575 [Streptomonospora nanhaiensis]|uniref:Uncharacterized protein n=1 Tax=Streptomonospora nanhaiensis TaxID=1323731 RepID=A0A853BKX8_9ACTN|nr:hypothetical protein [Streptomonospora nanhaiensis]MBV2363008.1 hypothetical protein [Streptomonospora nanhaiensis]MBX9387054.1 hypothetical protein [Streptomonospora nanhaiensis]NYI95375.1 hypothetical protein [Streptomonospora nanhaiensis]
MRLPGRAALPAEVRARVRLARGERVLAHTGAAEGTLVATDRALHLPDGRAVPWEHVDRARWTEDAFAFVEEGRGEHRFAVADPGRLAEVVYERVTATILVSRHVPLGAAADDTGTGADPDPGAGSAPATAGRGFRLVARRPPGGSDVTWQVHMDEGVDPQDPRVAARVAPALAALRDQMGV